MFFSQQMKHFITTPFCVRRSFKGQVKPLLPTSAWLDHRLKLFEDFCLPSVVSQTDQNFEWFIYFDELTPVDYLERIKVITAKYKNISIKLCALWETAVVAKDIAESVDDNTKWIITTRLDNDDGLHRDFVSSLHAASGEKEEFLNFPRGIIFYSGKCYLYQHLSNAFMSLVEPVTNPHTVWCVAHEQAATIAPVRQLSDAPAFLQVVHDKNVSNKPRGTRVYASQALNGFEAIQPLHVHGKNEAPLSVIFENSTTVLLWKIRDLLISVVKKSTRRLGLAK
jgi:hypothetical protein